MDSERAWKCWSLSKILILLFLNIFPCTYGLYEDQIGKFDWRKQYIGRVEHVYFNPVTRRLCVGTNQNVIAALNLRSGGTIWRQIYESNPNGDIDLFHGWKDELFVISGDGKVLRNWDISNGYINWESSLILPIHENILNNFYYLKPEEEQLVAATLTTDAQLHVTVLNYTSNSVIWTQSYAAPWVSHSTTCQFLPNLFFACIDQEAFVIYKMKIAPNSKFTASMIPRIEKKLSNFKPKFVSSSSFSGDNNQFFGVTVDEEHMMLAQIENDIINFVRGLPQVLTINVVENNGEYLLFTLHKNNEKIVLEVNNGVDVNASRTAVIIDVPSQHYGIPEKMWISMFSRKEGDTSHRILFTTQDDALMLNQMNGKVVWIREEALASVANVEMIDLPMSESDIQFEQEFRLDDTNLFTMLLKRLTSQVFQLENTILSIISGIYPRRNLMAAQSSSSLTRDVFNINKIIVVVTLSGKLFGIDSTSGKIIWQQFLSNLEPFDANAHQPFSLFSQTKTTHFSQLPQCALIGVNKQTKNGLIYQFHSLTGEEIGVGTINLDFKIAQVMLLPPPEDDYLRGILLLDTTGHVFVYPESATQGVRDSMSSFFLFTAKPKSTVTGFKLTSINNKIMAMPIWNVKLPQFHSITQVVTKPLNEHVHSQGRVMGDRSVMYKYLNPNLVGVIAKGTDSQLKPFFKIILVDVITGNIVFSAVHKRCRGPIHAVLSENWAVYAYYNEKSRRTEMTVLELYEGKVQSNSTAFSSLNPPQLPMVERQAYLFPLGLNAMAVTITEKGITSKHLLFALPNGGIIELPKSVLDPRRSVFPSPEHREESIYPYVPELPVPSESVINYNQSVYNVRGISTAATGLESTCLVFAYGLDLFFARVTPSRTFDVLKDDFDHFLISVVLISLILGAYLIRQLAARKALHQAWK